MPELRQNFFTKEWVVIATDRAKRPEQMVLKRPERTVASFVATCPFCPGNESQTPPEIVRVPAADGSGWAVRLIPNKFAALGGIALSSMTTTRSDLEALFLELTSPTANIEEAA